MQRMRALVKTAPARTELRHLPVPAPRASEVLLKVSAAGQAFRCLRKGGRVALVGLPDRPLALEIGKEVVFKEAKIIGIHGRKMFETWTRMENLLLSGRLDVLPAVTHVLPLERWQEAFDLASSGKACKVVFEN